jgi:8-oxo-dGTP pyrophosphatase MutT (NUDIX family)
MIREHSYGIIPFRRINNEWEVLLVQLHAGHWGFPKGHADEGESPLEAAKRELLEESCLKVVCLLGEEPFSESYTYADRDKTVTYFLAEVAGEVSVQAEEVADFGWFSLPEAENRITFPELKSLWLKVEKRLQS